ncbi:hypothetical protein BGZ95_005966 [Linnemannia exigua]|uniref:Uncharacterized protein n=1 Tax=Linnemannia exigua TaxID=604196 RepID=A0AAD4H1A7_9FUNG|nr:hypothetical protein BGZ95_005966 [Linnemannia exigua]
MTSDRALPSPSRITSYTNQPSEWLKYIPAKRVGASYFRDTTPLSWSSNGYFTFRGATLKTKDRLVSELGCWIQVFKESGCQILVNKAQFLERESTTEYWTQLTKDQYRQECSTLNLKRGIAIRKENLKQHNYYSQIMTDELKDIEQVNYIHQPINPFLAVKDINQCSSNTPMSSVTPTPKSAKVSFKDDMDETNEDSDGSYEPSSELSSQGSSPRRPLRRWVYLYPQGQGQLRYPADFQRPWMIGKHNVAGILCALNHIYLVQRDDVSSSLFVALGDELWDVLQAPSLDNLMNAKTIEDLFDVAVRLATLRYQDGRKLARRWDGDDAVGEVLSALTKTSALWDTNRAQDNEVTDTKKRNDPFLEADTVFPPSEARRSSASSRRGARPDYFSKIQDRGRSYFPLVVEIKKTKQGECVLLSDLEKIALQMKDSLDSMAHDKINLEGVQVYGYTIVEHEIYLYSMTIEAPGIYIMREISKAYLPRNHADMSVLPFTINLFKNLQQYLKDSASLCGRPLLAAAYDGVVKTLGTPMKRPRSGWDATNV